MDPSLDHNNIYIYFLIENQKIKLLCIINNLHNGDEKIREEEDGKN